MLAHELTGIPMEQIEVIAGDTDRVSEGHGTFGSRSLQLGGSAVWTATEQVVEKARQVAAELLEANPADVVLDTDRGEFHVAGSPSVAKTWAEVGAAGDITGPIGEAPAGLPIEVALSFTGENATFPFGAHVAVVEVDTETGRTRLRRSSPATTPAASSTRCSSRASATAASPRAWPRPSTRRSCFDDDGNPQTANLADYAFVSAAELPSFDLVPLETPSPVNPLGAKGIGESGSIGSTPAVQSAVLDALSPFGVRPPRHAPHRREGVAGGRRHLTVGRPDPARPVVPGSGGGGAHCYNHPMASKQRWQSSARWTLVAVVGVVVIGGFGFYWFFLHGDAPKRAALPSRSAATTLAAGHPGRLARRRLEARARPRGSSSATGCRSSSPVSRSRRPRWGAPSA